ncbi:MAG: GIY-YIG nuclease family protein [Candidatus Korobacteraceae bacterium]|jgi:hypothetical protein
MKMDLDLKDLLNKHNVDPSHVLVLRHTPPFPQLRKVFARLAADHPAAFNAYQQTQRQDVEDEMDDATHVASFIGNAPGCALFVGLYRHVAPPTLREAAWIRAEPGVRTLESYGLPAETIDRHWFDLQLQEDFHADWKGKLVIQWPGREINWHRWADAADFRIGAIHEESRLCKPPGDYEEWDLSWDELRVLPESWKSRLREWRGIYLIFDKSDGKGYVGSAYGKDNILGRWQHYADKGDGGNKELRTRKATEFRFSILELVSPAMKPEEVIRREENWKIRLRTRTRTHGLNIPDVGF